MAVNPTKHFRYVVSWIEDGESHERRVGSKKAAAGLAEKHEGAQVEYKEVDGPKSYTVTYRDAFNKQRTKQFTKKGDADRFNASVVTDKARGTFIDPKSGKVTFEKYAEDWLRRRRLAATSRIAMASRFNRHVYPVMGHLFLSDIGPEYIEEWLNGLDMGESTRDVLFTNVKAIFEAAVDNKRIGSNPCKAPTVKANKPKPIRKKVVPWTTAQVADIRAGLPERYEILTDLGSGLGLRQGEVFGLSPDDIDWLRGVVHVRRQVVVVGSRLHFGPPKGGKERDVPLPDLVKDRLAAYLVQFRARKVTLDWTDTTGRSAIKDGTPVTVSLLLTSREHKALNKNYINDYVWKVAVSGAGIAATREHGMHALRHHYASVLLAAGVDILTVSENLGHHDPAFTLRTYTHLMSNAGDRTKSAIDAAFAAPAEDEAEEQGEADGG